MKKIYLCALTAFIAPSLHACLNIISNNTNDTYKIVEVKENNKSIKKQIFLPNEYLDDETKAHTILPGEEVAFGGHYVPTFVIFKQYPDEKWHSLLVVKQKRCGPRGPENKYLLITDLLNMDLPGDYNDVYTFTPKKELQELAAQSTNTKALTEVKNEYQVIFNLLGELIQKVQELMSKQVRAHNGVKHRAEVIVGNMEMDNQEEPSCEACSVE